MTVSDTYSVLMPVDPGEEVVDEVSIETEAGRTYRFYDREAEGPSRIYDYILFNEREVTDANGNVIGDDDE